MSDRDKIINEIMLEFYTQDKKWRVDGKLTDPTPDDVSRTLDRLQQMLYDGEEASQASTGGILVQKNAGHYDVYLHLGEL